MKRYIRNSLILLVGIAFILSFVDKSVAGVKEQYYLGLFRGYLGYGENSKYFEAKEFEDNSNIIHFTDLETDNNYLILLSSTLDGSTSLNSLVLGFSGDTIFVICNTNYSYQSNFNCGYDFVSSENSFVLKKSLPAIGGNSINLGVIQINNTDVYFIPELYFLIPESNEILSSFLKKQLRTSSYLGGLGSIKNKGFTRLEIRDLRSSVAFEILSYTLPVVVLLIVFRSFLSKILKNPRILMKKDTYKKFIDKILNFISSYSTFFDPLILLGFIGIFPILAFISAFDKGQISLSYMFNYFVETMSTRSISHYISNRNTTRVGIFLYASFISLILLIRFLPQISILFDRSIKMIFKNKRVDKNVKWIPTLLISICIPVVIISGLLNSYLFIIFSISVASYFLYLLEKSNHSFYKIFKKREKIWIIIIVTLVFSATATMSNIRENKPIKYIKEDLIKVTDNIVLLPYFKDYQSNVLFNEFLINIDAPIFADNYLIYYPGAKKVFNRNIDNFNNSNSFLIQNFSKTEFFSKLLENKDILFSMVSDTASSLLYISDYESDPDSLYSIVLDFNCTYDLLPSELELFIYQREAPDNKEIKSEDKDLFLFPGCSKSRYIQSYKITYAPSVIDSGEAILYFDFKNETVAKGLSEIRVYKDSKEIESIYLDYDINSEIVVKRFDKGLNEIYFYTFNNIVENSINISSDRNFDLSQSLNELRKKDLLGNPFIIWSSEPNVILRNSFVNN